MLITMATEDDLDSMCELLGDAVFRDGVFHVVAGDMVFTCETLRAVPDKAEEYWMGPIHRTRIPWTKCLMEFIGITRCQVREVEAHAGDGSMLSWDKQGEHYVVRVRTPQRVEMALTLQRLNGRCEDVGQLIWQR